MSKRNQQSKSQRTKNTVTRFTADSTVLPYQTGIASIPFQRMYRYDLLAREAHRISVSVGVSPATYYWNFALNQIPNVSEYTALYDAYRIKQVVVYFRPAATQVYTGNSSGDVPTITTALDYNDNSTAGVDPTEYQTAMTCQMTTAFARKLSPRTAIAIYNGVSNAYIQGSPNQWIDCGYPAVPHYQLIVQTGSTSIDNQFVYIVDILYTLEFKTVR